jgi:serine protease
MAEVATAASAASSTSVSLATSLKMHTSSIAPDTQTSRFIIKYKTGTAERGSTIAVQAKLDRLASALPARAHHSRRLVLGADVVTTERALNARDAKAFMRAIASDPNVEYVEPDTPMSIDSVPNDPDYSDQWGLFSTQDPGQTAVGIRAENAWNIATGAGISIGLVDNGVTSHSDLNANVLPGGFDFTFLPGPGDGTNPGRTVEGNCAISFHGTHVAGIMAALTNNGIGIAGVAPSAKVLSVRALSACGAGSVSSIVEAMVWAAGGTVAGMADNPRPVKLTNASLSGAGQCSQTYQDAIDYVNRLGAIVIVAAGNDSGDASNHQPANCHGVINVGNSQRDGSRNPSSNYGPMVDIAAPGTDILSTYNDGTSALGNESYAYMTGTSMATPMVTGVIALAQSVAPTPLSVAEMRTLLQQNAQPFPKTPDQPIGAGIVDATATVAAAKSGKIPVAADFTCSEWTNSMTVTCTDLSTARSGVPIKTWVWNLDTGYAPVPVSQTVNPYASYEYPGVRQVSLTVTDANGATSTLSRPIMVAPPSVTSISNNYNAVVSGDVYVEQYYELDVPAGATNLTASLTPSTSSEGAWLYIKAGSPTDMHADCQKGMANGNAATCSIDNPASGPYYVIVNPQSRITHSPHGVLQVIQNLTIKAEIAPLCCHCGAQGCNFSRELSKVSQKCLPPTSVIPT